MIKVPNYVSLFANLCKHYGKIYIVGGFVRDSLQNIPSHDIDLCGSIKIDQLQNILTNSQFEIISTNKTFGTAKIKFDKTMFEYTTFRKDVYPENGKHTPKKVDFVKDLYEDSKRRDFTINCLYYDILDNILIDPSGNGFQDLKNKVINTVLDPDITLSKDGERLLRMIKLKVKYNLNIRPYVLEKALKYKANLLDLSQNIIQKFVKFATNLSNPQKQQVCELLTLFCAQNITSLIR